MDVYERLNNRNPSVYVLSLTHYRNDNRSLGIYGVYSSLDLAREMLIRWMEDTERIIDKENWDGLYEILYTDMGTWEIEKVILDENI